MSHGGMFILPTRVVFCVLLLCVAFQGPLMSSLTLLKSLERLTLYRNDVTVSHWDCVQPNAGRGHETRVWPCWSWVQGAWHTRTCQLTRTLLLRCRHSRRRMTSCPFRPSLIYLQGTIPAEWSSMTSLTALSIYDNSNIAVGPAL